MGGMELEEMDYQGVKIDKCLSCEEVSLDAGELETVATKKKLILEGFLKMFQ